MSAPGTRAAVLVVALAIIVAGARAGAQGAQFVANGGDSVAKFLAAARSATARYHEQRAAVEDGYVLMGPDFPGMGQHWVNLAIVFSRTFDASRPSILEYAAIEGRPALVGVAYALPLLAQEEAPDFPSVDAWHGHHGTVDEEARVIGQMAESHGGMGGARLAMLHAWVWLDNPAGPWASDNWALPFARAGLAAPAGVGAAAARAMSLAVGGAGYFTLLIEADAGRSVEDSVSIRGAVMSAARTVERWRADRDPGPITASELGTLRAIWSAMWRELATGATPDARAPIAVLARELDR